LEFMCERSRPLFNVMGLAYLYKSKNPFMQQVVENSSNLDSWLSKVIG